MHGWESWPVEPIVEEPETVVSQPEVVREYPTALHVELEQAERDRAENRALWRLIVLETVALIVCLVLLYLTWRKH